VRNRPTGASSVRFSLRRGWRGRFRRSAPPFVSIQIINESQAPWHIHSSLAAILGAMRHDGCGGRVAKAELLTGVEGVSSRPVRRIVLRDG
jgi:hypothetical protein